ncbi:unnamed protein product [Rotaria sordida]|uniref:Uncharacterized protein n=1 Tax=Rotaria sordida TaxID=392033 RepID=A0A813WCQ3_9BILA|nr:unnamed protein product [Rotaria sordida]
MANVRKSIEGRKRARTMEYIDSQVDINDDEPNEKNTHIGQHIHAQFDVSMSFIDETNLNESTFERILQPIPLIPKITKKRDSERSYLQRQISDISLNRFMNDTNKTTTELKGRDHIVRVMKTTNNKPVMDFKNHRFIQEMIAKRQEKQESNKPLSDFALKYGLIDNNGKKSKSRKTSELIIDMEQQLESLKPTLTKRQIVDTKSPLLRVVKLESVCNQLLCYCQYVTDQEDLVLFLDPNDEQSKNLAINDEIRIAGESQLNMNLPELGSVILGITDVRKESTNNNEEDISMEIIHTYDFNCSCNKCTLGDQIDQDLGESQLNMNLPELGSVILGITDVRKESTNNNEEDISMEMIHTYDFNCSCNKCTLGDQIDQDLAPTFDLLSTFPNDAKHQQQTHSIENIYDSFTLALMSKRKFDLRATIIIYDPDIINNRYIFIVRDGIGNCLQILLTDINGLYIELKTRNYIFHQIEFIERIESPKESNRWPYEDYLPPKKLFCFRSIHNQVSIL